MSGSRRSFLSALRDLPVKNPKLFIGIVGVVALMGAGAAVGVVLNLANHEARVMALETLRRHPGTAALLGRPVEAGWFTTGSVTFGKKSDRAELNFAVSGPRGDGRVHLTAVRQDDAWEVYYLFLETDDRDERIDLLAKAQ